MSYGQDYYSNYGGLSVADYVDRYVRGSSQEMARTRQTVQVLPPDVETVLDVGAGHGLLLEELEISRGIRGVGIEITHAKIEYARSRGIDMRHGDAARLDFGDRSFDAVVLCEVLEHLPFGVYESALRECVRVARNWVVVTVPYDESRRFVKCPYCSAQVNPDYHFRSFAPDALPGLMPGFRLRQRLLFGSKPHSILLDAGRQWIKPWPQFLTCPSCGYHQQEHATAGSGSEDARGFDWLGLGRRLATRLTLRARPIWLVGLFCRD